MCTFECSRSNNPIHSPQGFSLIISDHQVPKRQLVFTSLSIKEGDVNCILALPTPSEMLL